MFEPILVTKEEYQAIAFAFFIAGMFLTMHFMFAAPHERDQEDDDEF